MKLYRMSAIFFAIVLSCRLAAAYSGVTFFGDSLMDVGNVWVASSHTKPLCGDLGGDYWNGRFCNGLNYADRLSAYLGLPSPTPSVLGGNDYAWGGAGTATTGVSSLQTPNLGTQVSTFLADLNGSQLDADRLVVLWAGGNDPIYEGQSDYSQSVANIADAVTHLATQGGAKHILVNNLPLLGQTPGAIKQGEPLQSALNGWSLAFDATLAANLASLQTSLGPAGVTILDTLPGLDRIDVRFGKIIADPAAFGVTNVTDQAYLTTDSGIKGVLVPNSEHYLFWDFVHPTEYGTSLLVPEPSMLVFLITAAFVGLWWRKRA
jgi:phospholipase/lecithinase/hemolysin